ncbi:tRNA-modifying protein YgfZ [Shewanella sp. NIFS-20-20]|uniref:tRNA-modifying protein YgfZ n=1 Tax=Shewanella sp. NIFS-20-20 TaxID=2853806 RepID=UPI001C460CF9|nr:tRNA-modifying protein YgfZ [Shewanella sp. NIFS-20-20]MBV7314104.1 tRNA-modifying protein YgfZ [Shewanella sp. NIFS-20-20]
MKSAAAIWPVSISQPSLALCQLSHFGLLQLKGEQARVFLNGQVTADISQLADNQWRFGAHCDPKGKALATFRVFGRGDCLTLLMPTDTLAIDLVQMQKYAVFSKVELSDVSAHWQIFGLLGSDAEQFITAQFGDMAGTALVLDDGSSILQCDYGYILVLSQQHAQAVTHQHAPVSAHLWQAVEIAAGVANIGAENSGQFVPQMFNWQAIDGISFTKGCYMGQETIARMKYRGGNKRALYVVQGEISAPIESDTQLEMNLGDNWRKAGTIIESTMLDGRFWCSAVLANDTAMDTQFRLSTQPELRLSLMALPYTLDSE